LLKSERDVIVKKEKKILIENNSEEIESATRSFNTKLDRNNKRDEARLAKSIGFIVESDVEQQNYIEPFFCSENLKSM
jgi:hypothetical protein